MTNPVCRKAEVAIDGELGLSLLLARLPLCSGCQKVGGCGIALFAAPQRQRVPLPGGLAADLLPGMQVDAQISAGVLMRMSLLAFLLPALGLVLGSWLASQFWSFTGDFPAFAGALGGLALCCGGLRLYDSHRGSRLWRNHLSISQPGRAAGNAV